MEGKRNVPGPGAYGCGIPADKDKFSRSASFTMGGSGRDGKAWGVFPGPGAYKVDVATTAPKWVFSSDDRLRVKKTSPTPGPGAYHNPAGLEGRQTTICGKPEGKPRATTPGPGAYQPNYSNVSNIETIPKVSFGASSRSDTVLAKGPGPGTYNHDNFMNGFRASAKYSIKSKYDPPAPEVSPGPMSAHTQFV